MLRLYGLAEIGEALHVPRNTVAVWYRRKKLPKPDCLLHMGPVWAAETIEPWLKTVEPREAG